MVSFNLWGYLTLGTLTPGRESARNTSPRMEDGANGSQHWARAKGRAELELANLATGGDLRTYSYRSAYVRRTSEQANVLDYIGEALLRPGKLVIPANELGNAMLEISARASELENGTLIDNADSIAYAEAYHIEQ